MVTPSEFTISAPSLGIPVQPDHCAHQSDECGDTTGGEKYDNISNRRCASSHLRPKSLSVFVDAEQQDPQLPVAAATLYGCVWDDWDDSDWDDVFHRVMDVNLLGTIHVVRAFMPGMIERKYGRIVVVSSLAGRTGGLIASPHYVASKGGLLSLVKWLAQRGAPHNVIANGVAPASVDTEMMRGQTVDVQKVPLGRMAQPDEVAWPITFLISPAASYVCGAILDVNGGVYMG